MLEECLYKKFYNKWLDEFITDVDLSQLKWIKLNSHELVKFYEDNYYDSECKCFALSTKKIIILSHHLV